MKFLLDANMSRSALQIINLAGYESLDVRDIGLGSATDDRIDQFALQEDWIWVTRDLDFSDIRNYPPVKTLGRVILRLSDFATSNDIVTVLRRFLAAPELVSQIPGHLVIIDTNQVRFRPALVE